MVKDTSLEGKREEVLLQCPALFLFAMISQSMTFEMKELEDFFLDAHRCFLTCIMLGCNEIGAAGAGQKKRRCTV